MAFICCFNKFKVIHVFHSLFSFAADSVGLTVSASIEPAGTASCDRADFVG
jgi:hypothetical protein